MLATLAQYKLLIVAAVLAALLAFGVVQTVRLERSRAVFAMQKAETLVLGQSLDAHRASLAHMKVEAERRDVESAKALEAAKKTIAKATQKANAVADSQVPTDCGGATAWAAGQGPVLGAW